VDADVTPAPAESPLRMVRPELYPERPLSMRSRSETRRTVLGNGWRLSKVIQALDARPYLVKKVRWGGLLLRASESPHRVRLLSLGATGRTGRLVVQYALSSGHDVVALARNPRRIAASSPNLSIVTGTPENAEDIESALTGCDAVISTLGNSRSSDLPWAKLVSPPMFMTRSISDTINAMRARGIRRIVVVSALGAGDSFPHAPFITRLLARRTNLRWSYADHEAQEEVLRKSELDWTCVRPAILTDGTSLKPLVVSYEGRPKPALTITRALVARFLVDILDKPEFFRKMPVVSEHSSLAAAIWSYAAAR